MEPTPVAVVGWIGLIKSTCDVKDTTRPKVILSSIGWNYKIYYKMMDKGFNRNYMIKQR